MLRRLISAIAVLALLAAFTSSSFAQQGATCSIASNAPVVTTATSYTLSATDNCKTIAFSSASAITVSVPNAAVTMPVGWSVWLKAIGSGTITVATPTTSTMDGASSPISLTTGKGVRIVTDGTNYISSGVGQAHP